MEHLLTYLVAALVPFCIFLYFYSKWKHNYWARKSVVQLETEFFYGNGEDLVKGKTSLAEMYLDIYQKFKSMGVKYGGTYTVFRPTFVPIDPDIIKTIMLRDFEYFTAHFPVFRRNRTIFSMNVFHLDGEAWRQTRKKLTPTFTSGKMKMMFETLMEKTWGLGELADDIALSGEPCNIKEVLGRFTTDVIGSCGFGLECNSLKNPDSEFLKNGRAIFDPPEKKENYWDLFLRVINLKTFKKDLRPVENFFKSVVSDTIDYREKNKIYRKDFLHLMIQLKNRGAITDDEHIFDKQEKVDSANTFNIDEVTAQCMIFFIAGYETSATTMTFALLELAKNEDLQEKLRQEVNEVLKKHDGKLTYDTVMDLTYAEKVVQETLRRYPPVSVVPRVCTKNYTIPGTDIVIEKGTTTNIPAWGLHMDTEYFPNPEKFDPERFNEENKAKIRDFTYLPFGEGPRMCLGLRFGMMQSKVGLVTLVKNYKFTLNKKTTFPLKFKRDTFITTVDGDIWLNIEKI